MAAKQEEEDEDEEKNCKYLLLLHVWNIVDGLYLRDQLRTASVSWYQAQIPKSPQRIESV